MIPASFLSVAMVQADVRAFAERIFGNVFLERDEQDVALRAHAAAENDRFGTERVDDIDEPLAEHGYVMLEHGFGRFVVQQHAVEHRLAVYFLYIRQTSHSLL